MSVDAANVTIPNDGAMYVAAFGTPAPTSHVSALNAAFIAGFIGYWHEDGLATATEMSTTDLRAFQNRDLIRTIITDAKATFTVQPIETTEAVIEFFYGTTVDGTDGGYDIEPARTSGIVAIVFDVHDGSFGRRYYLPRAELTERGEVSFVNGEVSGYPSTITAYKPTSGATITVWDERLIDES